MSFSGECILLECASFGTLKGKPEKGCWHGFYEGYDHYTSKESVPKIYMLDVSPKTPMLTLDTSRRERTMKQSSNQERPGKINAYGI